MEIWKSIKGYEGLYEVSDLGRVKSFQGREERLKKAFISHGYYKVNLYKDLKQVCFSVHVLIAVAFLNHRRNGHKLVVDHINNIKIDNRLENLQIITHRENTSKDRNGKYSKLTGVKWYKNRNKWAGSIQINGKCKHLGMFNTELEASNAYKLALKGL
mgnify:CR=1 FL=1|tara:strand:+ start:113 stop:586 length:474 start_codon:yes stop_codon:yes gene_type:complete